MRILLESNADMQIKDKLGNQPIHVAADGGHYEYVKCKLAYTQAVPRYNSISSCIGLLKL